MEESIIMTRKESSTAMVRYVLALLVILISGALPARTIYVNSITGNDQNSGLTKLTPIQSLSRLNQFTFEPGDSILLASGQEFKGNITISGLEGKQDKLLVISSYGADPTGKAIINGAGQLAAILVLNSNHVMISNLEMVADGGAKLSDSKLVEPMRCGILILANAPGTFQNITVNDVHIHDVSYEEKGFVRTAAEVKSENGTQPYGWGIRVMVKSDKSEISKIRISNSKIEDVTHTGIKLTGLSPSKAFIKNVEISDNRILFVGGPGIQMSASHDVHVHHNVVDHSGSDNESRKWGRGSGLWTWGSENILVERNSFLNANGPGDSAGAHIDFNCRNVVFQFNLSANNAGGFCEILGNNYNCAYRYNISVNDGYRIKGEKGAFQEGKIFWLSGYVGNKQPLRGPFNSYFYNNTIYVSDKIVAKIAVDKASEGILIANNIFHFEGKSQLVLGDQYKPEVKGETTTKIKNVFFQNNLFLNEEGWPKDVLVQPEKSLYGNVQFSKAGEISAEAYIPKNKNLIANKGIVIHAIPEDKVGLAIGLEVKTDILNHPIKGLPDLGAIEIK